MYINNSSIKSLVLNNVNGLFILNHYLYIQNLKETSLFLFLNQQ